MRESLAHWIFALGLRMLGFAKVYYIWEFPKIGDPNIVPLNSRIPVIRTQNKVPPIFGNPHIRGIIQGERFGGQDFDSASWLVCSV